MQRLLVFACLLIAVHGHWPHGPGHHGPGHHGPGHHGPGPCGSWEDSSGPDGSWGDGSGPDGSWGPGPGGPEPCHHGPGHHGPGPGGPEPWHYGPHHHPCHGQSTTAQPPLTNDFNGVADAVIRNDESYKTACTSNTIDVQETYGTNSYVIKYTLPNYEKNNFLVQAKHRVLSVTVTSPNGNIKDVRVLSDILNVQQAQWSYTNGVLEVFIPYNVAFNVAAKKTCLGNINKDVVNIQEGEELDINDLYRHTNSGLPASQFSPKHY